MKEVNQVRSPVKRGGSHSRGEGLPSIHVESQHRRKATGRHPHVRRRAAADITLNSQFSTIPGSWPSPSMGWTLQQNTNSVASVNWSNVSGGVQENGTEKFFVINRPTGNRFYRLHKP